MPCRNYGAWRTFAARWLRRARIAVAVALGFATLLADGAQAPAQAQAPVSIEFRAALEPYGAWRAHPRWGEVWVPARRVRDWRPYQNGRWVYTEDWGWYWVSDRTEDDWGWVTFHYGRWVFDRDFGWIWLSGEEWGPAWVDWRRGDEFVGWAPLPPDEIIVEMRDEPEIWLFVRAPDLIAPRVRNVILPPRRRAVLIRETVVENRTIVIEKSGARIAVNPGIPPAYIAAAARRPLPAYQVRPRVLAGTRGVEGGIEIRAADIRPGARRDRARFRDIVQPTANVIPPAPSVPPPQPLRPDEKGRLGENPPRAALGATQPVAGPPPSIPSPGAAPEQSQPSAVPAEQPRSSAPTIPEQRRETAPAAPPPAPAAPAPVPGATPPAGTSVTPAQPRDQRRPATEQPPGRQPGAATPSTPPAQPQAPRPPRPTPPSAQQPATPPARQSRPTPPAGPQPSPSPQRPAAQPPSGTLTPERAAPSAPARPRPETPRAEPPRAPVPPPAAREPPRTPPPAAREAPPSARPAPAVRPAPPPGQAAPAAAPRPPAVRPAPAPQPPAEEKKDDKEKIAPRF